jgi:hypothetical protein
MRLVRLWRGEEACYCGKGDWQTDCRSPNEKRRAKSAFIVRKKNNRRDRESAGRNERESSWYNWFSIGKWIKSVKRSWTDHNQKEKRLAMNCKGKTEESQIAVDDESSVTAPEEVGLESDDLQRLKKCSRRRKRKKRKKRGRKTGSRTWEVESWCDLQLTVDKDGGGWWRMCEDCYDANERTDEGAVNVTEDGAWSGFGGLKKSD